MSLSGSLPGEIVSVSGSGSASGEMSSSGAGEDTSTTKRQFNTSLFDDFVGSDEESSTTIPLPEFEMTDERNKSFTGQLFNLCIVKLMYILVSVCQYYLYLHV